MRSLLTIALLLAGTSSAFAVDNLPEGAEELLGCGHVYSMKADDAKEAGDEGGATEMQGMSDAYMGRADILLAEAGLDEVERENVVMSTALIFGFRYGAGEGDDIIAACGDDTP